jgi:hypothetical protein
MPIQHPLDMMSDRDFSGGDRLPARHVLLRTFRLFERQQIDAVLLRYFPNAVGRPSQ